MTARITITIEGILTADPRVEQQGRQTRATFTVKAANPTRNRRAKGSKLGEPMYFRCFARGRIAVNVAKLLSKGDSVAISGDMQGISIEGRGGKPRPVVDVWVNAGGLSLDDPDLAMEATPEGGVEAPAPSPAGASDETSEPRRDHNALPRHRIRTPRLRRPA
jgi:single-stranded DNA-binding protein